MAEGSHQYEVVEISTRLSHGLYHGAGVETWMTRMPCTQGSDSVPLTLAEEDHDFWQSCRPARRAEPPSPLRPLARYLTAQAN